MLLHEQNTSFTSRLAFHQSIFSLATSYRTFSRTSFRGCRITGPLASQPIKWTWCKILHLRLTQTSCQLAFRFSIAIHVTPRMAIGYRTAELCHFLVQPSLSKFRFISMHFHPSTSLLPAHSQTEPDSTRSNSWNSNNVGTLPLYMLYLFMLPR